MGSRSAPSYCACTQPLQASTNSPSINEGATVWLHVIHSTDIITFKIRTVYVLNDYPSRFSVFGQDSGIRAAGAPVRPEPLTGERATEVQLQRSSLINR